jgi:hypothetical protein
MSNIIPEPEVAQEPVPLAVAQEPVPLAVAQEPVPLALAQEPVVAEPLNIHNELNVQCFICRDTANILYKICDCNDSIICIDCYNMDSSQRMLNCGICRKQYLFNITRNYTDSAKILISYGSKYGVVLFIELFCPFFIYSQSEQTDLSNIFILFSIYCVVFVNTLNYYLTENVVNNVETTRSLMIVYTPIKCLYILLLFIIIQYIYEINTLKLYTYYILIVVYNIPLFFLTTIILIRGLFVFFNYVNEQTISKSIKIKSIIHQS